ERQKPVEQPVDRPAVDLFKPLARIPVDADEFDHAVLWKGEALSLALHDKSGDDRQCERNLDDEARTCSFGRLEFDDTADLLDVVAHHIHTHAATGDTCHCGGG